MADSNKSIRNRYVVSFGILPIYEISVWFPYELQESVTESKLGDVFCVKPKPVVVPSLTQVALEGIILQVEHDFPFGTSTLFINYSAH